MFFLGGCLGGDQTSTGGAEWSTQRRSLLRADVAHWTHALAVSRPPAAAVTLFTCICVDMYVHTHIYIYICIYVYHIYRRSLLRADVAHWARVFTVSGPPAAVTRLSTCICVDMYVYICTYI